MERHLRFGHHGLCLCNDLAGVLTDVLRTLILGVIVFLGLALASAAMAGLHSAFILPLVIFALRFFGQGMCFFWQ